MNETKTVLVSEGGLAVARPGRARRAGWLVMSGLAALLITAPSYARGSDDDSSIARDADDIGPDGLKRRGDGSIDDDQPGERLGDRRGGREDHDDDDDANDDRNEDRGHDAEHGHRGHGRGGDGVGDDDHRGPSERSGRRDHGDREDREDRGDRGDRGGRHGRGGRD